MLKAARNIGIVLIVGIVWLVWAGSRSTRHPIKYLVPRGYVGIIRIEYKLKGKPKLPIQNGYLVMKIPADGRLQTSSVMESGQASDELYYYSGGNLQRLNNDPNWGGKGLMWGGVYNGGSERWFIGTEKQFKQHFHLPYPYNYGPIKPSVLAKLKATY